VRSELFRTADRNARSAGCVRRTRIRWTLAGPPACPRGSRRRPLRQGLPCPPPHPRQQERARQVNSRGLLGPRAVVFCMPLRAGRCLPSLASLRIAFKRCDRCRSSPPKRAATSPRRNWRWASCCADDTIANDERNSVVVHGRRPAWSRLSRAERGGEKCAPGLGSARGHRSLVELARRFFVKRTVV